MVHRGNVTGITDMLEEEGLVARTADPDDQRASRVKLTKGENSSSSEWPAEHERWWWTSSRHDRETEDFSLPICSWLLKTSAKQHLVAESEPRS